MITFLSRLLSEQNHYPKKIDVEGIDDYVAFKRHIDGEAFDDKGFDIYEVFKIKHNNKLMKLERKIGKSFHINHYSNRDLLFLDIASAIRYAYLSEQRQKQILN